MREREQAGEWRRNPFACLCLILPHVNVKECVLINEQGVRAVSLVNASDEE